ncbi:MAG: acyl--CoA ligase [Anaerolineae bacterium]|jgi:long-chain acyl-CoA synthetase|nr:acyl--CoA ligase [Anaerolineae bacterium]
MTAPQSLAAAVRAAHDLPGQPAGTYSVPFRNLRDVLALHAKTSPEKTFLIAYDGAGERVELSYVEFVARVHQVANFLYDDLHLQRGDCVATIGYNDADMVLLYFACWIIGAVVAPQNTAEDDVRLAYILRHSRASVCFVMHDLLARAETIIHGGGGEGETGAPNILGIVQVGGAVRAEYVHLGEMVRNRPTTFLGDESGAKAGDIPLLAGNERTATLEDDALLVYTSGTTGAPKGVRLTQYNLLVDAQGIAGWHAITGNQRLMCVLPMHHVNGIVVTLITPLLVGGSTVLNRQFSVGHFWERVVREKVHIVSVVPTLLQYLLEHAQRLEQQGATIFGSGIHRRNLARFRHFICGAGTLSVQLARAFEDKFGFAIVHGYGLSETTCYSCFLPVTLSWEEHQHWMQAYGYPSIGCPIAPNDMAILATDGSGQALAAGERGEIVVRGHNVMRDYFQRDDATAAAFAGGWFHTGDEGFFEVDAQGRRFFFITGRMKELINRGGVKFSPFEIEEVLLSYPGVRAALAIGFEHDHYGEEIGAYIVPQAETPPDSAALLAYARQRLGFDKAPKVVVTGADIPVTATGKYQRLRLRALFADYRSTPFRRP